MPPEKVDSHATCFDLRRWPKGLRMHRIIPHELIEEESHRTFQYIMNRTHKPLHIFYRKIYFRNVSGRYCGEPFLLVYYYSNVLHLMKIKWFC